MGTGLTEINKALNQIPKRAEQRQVAELRDTFVDSGVAIALNGTDHQVLYGRRGTGKTHALRYIESETRDQGDFAIYIDLRTIGSPGGLFGVEVTPQSERAVRLLVDVLHVVCDSVLEAAIADDAVAADTAFVDKLDAFMESITEVRESSGFELQREEKTVQSREAGIEAKGTGTGFSLLSRFGKKQGAENVQRITERGVRELALNFSHIATSFRDLVDAIPGRRFLILLDEWSSVDPTVQPFLAELVKHCFLPLQAVSVKIGAIEQQSQFRDTLPNGTTIGLELGADIFANVDLDEFMVFEQNEARARDFFKGLIFKHLTSGQLGNVVDLQGPGDVIKFGFSDTRAFDELVRAAEGVPRDALNIASKAALRAGDSKISVPQVRVAARSWFQTDKEGALKGRPEASRLLAWIIDDVIRGKRARAFLVDQLSASDPLLLTLFDARVLHVVRRGYSAQDEPGKRYDVWAIDYGAYVDLIQTKSAPDVNALFDLVDSTDSLGERRAGQTEVPAQDLRAIRRAILDLSPFYAQSSGSGK